MNAGTSTRARLENVSFVAQRDTRFLLAHDLQRTCQAVNLSNRLKVKAVLHLPRLRQSLHRVPSLRHSQRRKVPKEEVKGRKTSLPPSLKSSAQAGEGSFDNDDAEEEDPDAEHDWDEEEENVAEEQEDTFAERAFATAYHSHVCEVCDTDDGELNAPMRDTATHGESQELASLEEQWTTDEDAIDSAGPTRTPNSPVAYRDPVQARVPSEQARIAATAVMRTNFPNMMAEMNPNWDPLTEHDLLHRSDDTSDSVELVPSEEYWTEESMTRIRKRGADFPTFKELWLFLLV